MLFWSIAAALAALVGGLLVLALLKGRAGASTPATYDLQIYRDQLKEVERDLARGVVSEEEAARVRVEVSRRILEADRAAGSPDSDNPAPRAVSIGVAAVIGVLVVMGTLGLYNRLGAPGYPDLPLKVRIAAADEARNNRPGQASAEANMPVRSQPPADADPKFIDLMEKLRAAVAERPDDLRGQQLLARNEAMLGNYIAAHRAQAQVIELKNVRVTASDFADYADLLILSAGGYVSPEAETALANALELDVRNGPARYYTGLMYVQSGRPDLTFGIWRSLLEESRPEAPWYDPISARIAEVAQMAGVRYTPPDDAPVAGSGPSAADIEAAGDMTPEERMALIQSMVDRLSDRLASEGGPPEDWARLINALGVLGNADQAGAIWTEAQGVFADTPDALVMLRSAAESAGVAE